LKRFLIALTLVGLILIIGCAPSMKGYVTKEEFQQLDKSTREWVQAISQENDGINQELKEVKEKIEENANNIEGNKGGIAKLDERVTKLEDEEEPPPPPNDKEGTWLVYKASTPLTYGTVNFDVKELSSAGSRKDVMSFLGRGLTIEDYNTFRYDIRKYGEELQLMKSVLGRNGDAIESYWDNGGKIYWEISHTYHFTITWDENGVRATRYDKDTGETNQWSGNYPTWMQNGGFNPVYICIGWNPKYGIPPGGYYFNIVLPSQAEYELVKYKP